MNRRRIRTFAAGAVVAALAAACPSATVVDCLRDSDCGPDRKCALPEGSCIPAPPPVNCTGTGICYTHPECAYCIISAGTACPNACPSETTALSNCTNSSGCALQDVLCNQQKCPSQSSAYHTCMSGACCEYRKCF